MRVQHTHCSYCGTAYSQNAQWPRLCGECREFTYRNPLPVSVVLLPVGKGLAAIRRGIEPGRGKWALPGGFMDAGELWQEAASRELFEETGITIPADEFRHFATWGAKGSPGFLMVFSLAPPLAELPELAPNDEVLELGLLDTPEELAFPLHTRALREYLASRGG